MPHDLLRVDGCALVPPAQYDPSFASSLWCVALAHAYILDKRFT